MIVELGNPNPSADGAEGPAVTYIGVPDSYTYEVAKNAETLANDVAAHIGRATNGVTQLSDQEAVVTVIAVWGNESHSNPSWAWSDNKDFAKLLGKYFGCPVGRPDGIEATHFTRSGPPGVSAIGEDN